MKKIIFWIIKLSKLILKIFKIVKKIYFSIKFFSFSNDKIKLLKFWFDFKSFSNKFKFWFEIKLIKYFWNKFWLIKILSKFSKLKFFSKKIIKFSLCFDEKKGNKKIVNERKINLNSFDKFVILNFWYKSFSWKLFFKYSKIDEHFFISKINSKNFFSVLFEYFKLNSFLFIFIFKFSFKFSFFFFLFKNFFIFFFLIF